jgi:hypothetical protein
MRKKLRMTNEMSSLKTRLFLLQSWLFSNNLFEKFCFKSIHNSQRQEERITSHKYTSFIFQ